MTHWNLLRLIVVILASLAVGCGKDEPAEVGHDKSAAEDHTGSEQGETMEHTDGVGDAFAALSAEDQKLAKAQGTCPVSDEKLGDMGTPIKVMVGDTPVFICCAMCKKALLADPDKFLAKLK